MVSTRTYLYELHTHTYTHKEKGIKAHRLKKSMKYKERMGRMEKGTKNDKTGRKQDFNSNFLPNNNSFRPKWNKLPKRQSGLNGYKNKIKLCLIQETHFRLKDTV